MESETKLPQPSTASDPFLVFETLATDASSWPFSDPLEQNAGKGSVESSIDELEKFAMGKVPDDASNKPFGETLRNIRISLEKKNGKASTRKDTQAEILHEKQREKERVEKFTKEKKEAVVNEGNLDDIFGMDTHPGSVNRPISPTEVNHLSIKGANICWVSNKNNLIEVLGFLFQDPVFDTLFNGKRDPEVKKPSSRPAYNKEKSPSAALFFDDFSFFGGDFF